jgi:hypothetical protein
VVVSLLEVVEEEQKSFRIEKELLRKSFVQQHPTPPREVETARFSPPVFCARLFDGRESRSIPKP